MYYAFGEFIILWYTFLVICFAWSKECMIWLISFNRFSDVLPAFTCASASSNLWSIYLGVLCSSPLPFVSFFGIIPLLKALIIYSRPSQRELILSIVSCFFFFVFFYLGLDWLLKSKIFSNRMACFISASFILILPL